LQSRDGAFQLTARKHLSRSALQQRRGRWEDVPALFWLMDLVQSAELANPPPINEAYLVNFDQSERCVSLNTN